MSDTIIMYENGKAIGGAGHPISGGGHTIQDNSGTDMPQEDNLQFVGVYTEDDATNDRTKVNIVRPMRKEQMDALTPAQKKGFIRTTDEPDNPMIDGYEESGSLTTYIQSGFTSNDVTYYKKGNLVTIRCNGASASATGGNQVFLNLPSDLTAKIQTFAIVSNAAGTILGLAYMSAHYLVINVTTRDTMYFSLTYQC